MADTATDLVTAATPCSCSEDGFCPRYGRDMSGRLRQLCQGDGIEPLLVTQYRQLWLDQKEGRPARPPVECQYRGNQLDDSDGNVKTRDCAGCVGRVRLKLFPCNHPARRPEEVTLADCRECAWRPVDRPGARWLILDNHLSPGDVLAMTAAVYSLKQQYPDQYVLAVDTSADSLWEHNPDVVPLGEARSRQAEVVQMHYPLINQSNQRPVHFLQGYCDFLGDALRLRLPPAINRPLLYLSREEKSWLPQVWEKTGGPTRYWVVNAGRKDDYTAKWWGTENFQKVIDLLRGEVQFVQIGELHHHHPRLHGVLDLVGQTDARQLVRLCYHADGGLGGVTFLQHLMAALEKPYVCLLGGREGASWNTYPRQTLFSTVGTIACCQDGGCWKSRTVALGDGDEKDQGLCERPRWRGKEEKQWGADAVPACLDRIKPSSVAEAIRSYQAAV